MRVLALLLVLLLLGCAKAPMTDRGFSLSPKSFAQEDFLGFLEKARGGTVTWAGDWIQLADHGGSPHVLEAIATKYDIRPLVIVNPYSQDDRKVLRSLDEFSDIYKKVTLDFVQEHTPEYLGIGIEVNIFQKLLPEDFEKFVALYNDIYDEIKLVSPTTKVFTIFQLEQLRGLRGGLFGGTNDESLDDWELVDRFKSDVVGLTTYPSLIYKDPSEIPDDYYSEVDARIDKPLVFVEIGWHVSQLQGWESDGEEQARFIERFLNMTDGLDVALRVWSFMYDPSAHQPFDTMGLFTAEGAEKPGWQLWKW